MLATAIRHLQCGLHRRRHELSTDGASLRLLHGARCRRIQGACSSLPLTDGERLPLESGTCNVVCTQAVMKCQLMEQACGCFIMVRGAGGLKVRSCLCRRHSDGERLPLESGTCSVVCTKDAMKCRLMDGCSAVQGAGEHKVRARLCRCIRHL